MSPTPGYRQGIARGINLAGADTTVRDIIAYPRAAEFAMEAVQHAAAAN